MQRIYYREENFGLYPMGHYSKQKPNSRTRGPKIKAKILLKFFYVVGICKLEVMGTFTWVRYLIPPKLQSF